MNESGNAFLCDRLLVKKCVNVWFGGSDSRSFHQQVVGSWSHGSNPMELHGHGGLQNHRFLAIWLTLPAITDLIVTECNITRGVLRNHCLDIVKNFVVALALFALVFQVGMGSCQQTGTCRTILRLADLFTRLSLPHFLHQDLVETRLKSG